MDDSAALCSTIAAREKTARRLAAAEGNLASTPWHRRAQRRDLRQEIAALHSQIEGYNAQMTDERVLNLASDIGSTLWGRAARDIVPKKNPYGPDALARFDAICDLAIELGRDYALYPDGVERLLSRLPEVEAMVTRDLIESNARRAIEELAAIAASPEFMHEYDRDYEGKLRLWVQHVASGMRAMFPLDENGFGGVASKPYALKSIDPANPGELWDWERFTGLRIGQRIYEKAQSLEPDVRWAAGMLSEYSAPLRRRLHSADPYVWDGPCTWCNSHLPEQGIHHWMDASRSSFVGHP